MSSSESHATVTYTSISFDSNLPPWGFHLMDPDKFEAPEEASQSPEQAPPLPSYVPSLEHPPSLDYVPVPDYPEYLIPSDDEIPVEDQPLPVDALPTAPSSGYVANSDPKEDPKEDLADYPDEEEEEESSEDDDEDEEEEHLASADSTQPAIYSVPSAEDLEPFETDESAATPPSPQTIVSYASALTPPSLPPSPLSPSSSLLLGIQSPPIYTSPTYASAPLGNRAAMVQLRAASPLPVPSPPLLLPSTDRRSDIPEMDMSFWKRLCLTSPASRFEVGESSTAVPARQTGPTLARRVDYEFIENIDASIRASESRVMTAVEDVNERVIDFATTQRQDAHELQVCDENTQDDRALLIAQVLLLTSERRYFHSMDSSYEREAITPRVF
ncbi:hypothetical protein Tco_1115794, partial [Tanacetum coccineum]